MDLLYVTIVFFLVIVVLLVWLLITMRTNRDGNNIEKVEKEIELLRAELNGKQAESALTLSETLSKGQELLSQRLAEGNSSLTKRMSVLGELENRLGKLAAQTTQIEKIGENIQSLSNLLKPPKMRGGVGETLLENLLSQLLPPAMYEMQFQFSNGRRVDAVVRIGDLLMPIDAKFPLEAFERLQKSPEDKILQREFSKSFKKHTDDIADKYIHPEEKSTNFAVMYVPAEAIYYQLISQQDQDGFQYALSRRIIPSSPGHLYAFMASVAALFAELSLTGSDFAEGSRELINGIEQLTKSTGYLARYHERMESSIRALTTAFDRAKTELGKTRLQIEKLLELPGKPSSEISNIPGNGNYADNQSIATNEKPINQRSTDVVNSTERDK